jgi:hypothetical protein
MSSPAEPCNYCGRVSMSEPLSSSVALFCLPCVLRRCFPYFTRVHRRLLFGFYLVFAGLTFLLMLPGAISGHGEPVTNAVVASLLAFSGPFTGVISRGHYACPSCRSFTITLLPYCSTILGAGFLLQLMPPPVMRLARALRISAWVLALLAWFAGTLLSVLAANS